MCCRNGPRRQPLAVTLGQYAYGKYQERKQQRALASSVPETATHKLPRRSSPAPDVRERQANSEILEKAGIAPPSYEDAVNPTDDLSPRRKDSGSSSRAGSLDDRDDLSDADSFFEADGKESVVVGEAQADFVRAWKARRGERVGEGEKVVLTKWRQRRAERAMAKAEKAARRAERAAAGL